MSLLSSIVARALLFAAPVFCQSPPPAPLTLAEPRLEDSKLRWFELTETRAAVQQILGPPALAAAFGRDFIAWQYRAEDAEHDDFSHHFVFRKSTGTLVAVTRSYPEGRNLDWLFPGAETAPYCRAADSGPPYCLRLRRLSGGRLLLALGASKPGDLAGQLVLIRETELPAFHPWLTALLHTQRTQ